MIAEKPSKITVDQKMEVKYAIPLWLRDLQIAQAIERQLPNIEPYPEGTTRPDPIACVCYGPSLNDTWEQVKGFKYIMTCSGAHKFMVDRGVIPTWHVEVDPRPHKVDLMGPPNPETEYLIASTCHARVFDHLKGMNVKIWHPFDPDDEARRTLPPGDWAVTGGCSVGLRTLTLSRFLGFTSLHIFGMDGNEGKSGKHASSHPMQAAGHVEIEYPPNSGIMYQTTPAFFEAARGTFHELDQLPDVKATFYGEGLIQAMAKDYKPKPKPNNKVHIAIVKPELISQEYIELNAQLHRENLAYGVGAGRHASTVLKLYESTKSASILDYGCGKGLLAKGLPFPIWEYDPAIPGKEESPRPADLVCCFDVLEHVERDKLKLVLGDLRRCVKKVGYFIIHTGPAQKKYANGQNTHLIQKNEAWWTTKLEAYFKVGRVIKQGQELHVIVAPIKEQKNADTTKLPV